MIRRPTAASALASAAMRAAEAAVEPDEAPAEDLVAVPPDAPADPNHPARPPGRPKGRRPVAAKYSLHLDQKRHDALVRMAQDRQRSIHSLILEGIDTVIGKPVIPGWQ